MSVRKELMLRLEHQKKELELELARIENDETESSRKRKNKLKKNIKAISHDLKISKDRSPAPVPREFNDWII